MFYDVAFDPVKAERARAEVSSSSTAERTKGGRKSIKFGFLCDYIRMREEKGEEKPFAEGRKNRSRSGKCEKHVGVRKTM